MKSCCQLIVLLTLLLPSPLHAQDPQPPATTPADKPPAAVGEAESKPTRGFMSALGHNLVDDLKHMPRRNSLYFLAAGAAAAASVHPEDDDINAHLVGRYDALWKPGRIIGSTPVILGGGAAMYMLGRGRDEPRLQHLGLDEIEAALLAEGIVEGAKVAVRRDRPLRGDGTRQGGYSFPSGHSTMTFAAATVLQQHLGYKAGIPTYLVATYVAMSRLHDNRHFASDVAMGAGLGILIGRSVTWHGRNFYASPELLPGGGAIVLVRR